MLRQQVGSMVSSQQPVQAGMAKGMDALKDDINRTTAKIDTALREVQSNQGRFEQAIESLRRDVYGVQQKIETGNADRDARQRQLETMVQEAINVIRNEFQVCWLGLSIANITRTCQRGLGVGGWGVFVAPSIAQANAFSDVRRAHLCALPRLSFGRLLVCDAQVGPMACAALLFTSSSSSSSSFCSLLVRPQASLTETNLKLKTLEIHRLPAMCEHIYGQKMAGESEIPFAVDDKLTCVIRQITETFEQERSARQGDRSQLEDTMEDVRADGYGNFDLRLAHFPHALLALGHPTHAVGHDMLFL